jgi:hypothetical protein
MLVLLCSLAINTRAQQSILQEDSIKINLNPMLRLTFKPPIQENQQLYGYIKPLKHEMMYWPNFPLNAAQIESRNREWDRKYNQPVLKQMTNVIIDNYVNVMINGKKMPVAVNPKF